MSTQEISERISAMIARVASEKGLTAPPVSSDTVLLDSTLGIDSLDLAAMVVELTETTGKDPFQGGFIEFRTVGELSELYGDKNGA